MCLAISAKILKLKGEYATADFGGVRKDVNILLTPNVKPGDNVLVHAGFAIEKLSKELKEFEILLEE